MAAQISVIGHRMSASFFAARSAIETAFASIQSAEAPSTAAVTETVTHALDRIGQASALQAFEASSIAHEALQLAENLREFVAALDLPSDAALSKLYEQFSEEAECLALGADPELKASADLIRADVASGRIETYPDWPPPTA
jgi:hypothetical protein